MSPRISRLLRPACGLAMLVSVLTVAALAWAPGAKPTPTPYAKVEPAKNPVTLQLQADGKQVIGWISGSADASDKTVTVKLDGKSDKLTIDKNNLFTWPYKITKAEVAEFTFGDTTASIQLDPAVAASPGPAAFFIVDRTAYRPSQTLHFAAFLHNQDSEGEFVPLAKKAVDVELTSVRKGTKAAKLKLTSDEQGKIAGSYTFSDGDALDNYTLTIPGHRGSVNVLLGEYRKSKVRLKITGVAKDGKMKLSLEALDFLEKPVSIAKASFTAQVIRRGKEKTYTLKAEDFVYHEPRIYPLSGMQEGDIDSLSEEDLLLWEANRVTGQGVPGWANQALHTFSQELTAEGAKPAEHSFLLQKEWLKGDCSVVVQGVITDTNGREQRSSATIAIPCKDKIESKETKKTSGLVLDQRRFFTRQPIEIKATGDLKNATLVVMKLSFQTPSTQIFNSEFGQIYAYRQFAQPYSVANHWNANTETVRRTLVKAVPFKDALANLTLAEPGAYKLVATAEKKDGSTVQDEIAIIVKRPSDINSLMMKLDKDEIQAGDKLTGVIHSRYTNARALLTLRDSKGIRFTKPITIKDGLYKLNETLPAGLRYGCILDVIYPEAADHTHLAHAAIRIVPKERMLSVSVKAPEVVKPGETVNVDLELNRKEAVDLIVSVYDQSLLGIASDKSVDVRNFYLADDRVGQKHELAMIQRMIGGVKISTLLKKAEKLVKDANKKVGTPLGAFERQALDNLLAKRSGHVLYARDMAALLRLAGVDVYLAPYSSGTYWHQRYEVSKNDRLIDMLKPESNTWFLSLRFVGKTLLVRETHPSYASYAWHPVFGMDHYGYGYGPYSRYNRWNSGFGNNVWFEQTAVLSARSYSAMGGSWGNLGMASANSMHSFAPEAQGFISHLPASSGVPLLNADSDQGHIGVRRDFSDSAYWNASVRTDAEGRAKVSFKVPDSLTNWQVVVTAVSPKLHVGSGKGSFRTSKPVMVWPMLPRTFTEGDKVNVFASVHNRSDEPQLMKVRLKVENGSILTAEEVNVKVEPKGNVPVYWTFKAGTAGFTQLLMSVDCPAGSDASLKRLPVVRAAAEQMVHASGMVKDSATIEIPAGVDLKSGRLEVTVAPSLAADLADTLNYLVDYPYGCVEQTMSRFLPAIKVAQILRQFKVQHPELEKKLPGCVAGGIKRLLELQQNDGGWGWNGNGATHEMMTPYALFGLLQAEKAGYQIPNEQAVARGLARLETFINNMGDAQATDRVYCMYVLSHRKDLLPQWWTWVGEQVKSKTLSDYAMALILEMAVDKKQQALAKTAATKLRERAQKEGGRVYWQTAKFSRWGDDRFEITAVALKALVANDVKDPLIDGVLSFFVATKRGDRWNSTKDTAMILYAMTDYLAKSEYNPSAEKSLSVKVNDGAKQVIKFDDQLTKKIVVPGEKLKEGKNVLSFDTKMTGVLYRAVFRYWKTGRDIEPMNAGIKVERSFQLVNEKGEKIKDLKSGDSVPRGSYVLSMVTATRKIDEAMRYVLVENPKASGGETVPADDPRFAAHHNACTHHVLREDREAMSCFHHEQTPATLSVRTVFLAELAGEFMIPPARVELMYQTDTHGHSGSFVLKVGAK